MSCISRNNFNDCDTLVRFVMKFTVSDDILEQYCGVKTNLTLSRISKYKYT